MSGPNAGHLRKCLAGTLSAIWLVYELCCYDYLLYAYHQECVLRLDLVIHVTVPGQPDACQSHSFVRTTIPRLGKAGRRMCLFRSTVSP